MLPLIEARRAEIADLCRRFHVRRLEVFGSAARGTDFDPDRSDVDLLVTYEPDVPAPNLTEYFDLTEQLTALLGRPVDLVMSGVAHKHRPAAPKRVRIGWTHARFSPSPCGRGLGGGVQTAMVFGCTHPSPPQPPPTRGGRVLTPGRRLS